MIRVPKRILLTGGTGYLGQHLNRHFSDLDWQVWILTRHPQISNPCTISLEQVSAGWMSRNQITNVVHCATDYGRTGSSDTQITDVNFDLPVKLFGIAAEAKVHSFVNADTVLNSENSKYAQSKNQFRVFLQSQKSIPSIVNLRLEHFYGPGQSEKSFLVHVIRRLLSGEKRLALTPGEQVRNFIHVSDVVSAFEFAICHSPEGYSECRVGTEEAWTIKQTLEYICDTLLLPRSVLGFGDLPYRANELMSENKDDGLLKKMGWKPHIRFPEGLRELLKSETQIPSAKSEAL